MKKRQLSIFLLAALLLTTSCGSGQTVTPQVTDEDTTTETVSDTKYADSLPELNFNERTVTFHCSESAPDLIADDTGDVVDSAIYARNTSVQERLNVKFDYITVTDQGAQMKEAKKLLVAGDDSADIIAGVQFMMMPLALEGYLSDLSGAKYLDYDKPYWADSYMSASQWDSSRYALIGDISLSMLREMSCIFVNKRLYSDAFGSIDDFYSDILDGKWTFDVMNRYVKEVWQDLNSNDKADDGDIIGMRSIPGSPTEHFAFSAGMKFTERSSDGTISLIKNQERNAQVAEAIYKLFFENPGSYVDGGRDLVPQVVDPFINGQLLFCPIRTGTADSFRSMTDPYGIIPFPKLNENQESYKALVHDVATMFAIPALKGSDPELCAVLEAMCAENYRSVTPAYYEVALKVKYTQDDASVKLLDMIHDNVTTDFMYINNYCFNSGGSLGTIMRTLTREKNPNYMSTYDSMKTQVETSLKELINKLG